MKVSHYNLATAALLLLTAVSAPAAVFYVNVNSTNPVAPYSTWATAATAIQDAAGLATSGDTVLVTNGVYQTGGLKEISADITNRVVLTNAVTVKSINGPLVTIIQGYQPPAASNATSAVRCALVQSGGILGGFTLTGGQAGMGNYVNGGGAVGFASGLVSNCIITGNRSGGAGGGAYLCTMVNCLVTSNAAVAGGGLGGCTAYNCTVVGNNATNYGGGVYAGNTYNSVIFYNTASTAGTSNYYLAKTYYSCTSPSPVANGVNDIGGPPGFVNLTGGDYHLQIGSPCIDAGTNVYAQTTDDLDGNPRIVNGTVDMGAYEKQSTPAVHYVSLTSTNPVAPYSTWATAATNIQDAIGAAGAGEIVLASNGNYNLGGVLVNGVETNRVAITNPVTLLGYSGPQMTTITGGLQTRCVYVGSNALLSGFTLTGGQSATGDVTNDQSGTGAWCEASGVVSNCILTGNTSSSAYGYGGGDYGGTVMNSVLSGNFAGYGGGAAQATLSNCVLSSNSAGYGGGAAQASLINCTVAGNNGRSGPGGGLYQVTGSGCLIVSNSSFIGGAGAYQGQFFDCTFAGNVASMGAGGAIGSQLYKCILTGNVGNAGGATAGGYNFSCTITGNQATQGGGTYLSTNIDCLISSNSATGGNGGGANLGYAYSCVLAGNQATMNRTGSYGFGGGAYDTLMYNCTLVSNSAATQGGGAYGGTIYNSILYYNNAPSNANSATSALTSCCTTPVVGYFAGSFTNPPVFVNLAAGNFHEQTNSPTINAGGNFYLIGYGTVSNLAPDFDGNPRIVGGTVDMGAYEYQGSNLGLPIPIPWLVQYGLATDGSQDYVDSDGDGLNNWQEWFEGTNPKDPSSVLKMLPPSPSGSNIVVTWESVANHTYYLQRASGTTFPAGFQQVASSIPGLAGTTSYTDTNITGPGPFFYRIGANSQ